MMLECEKYENLGGVYFPILQQDGSRYLTKVGDGKDQTSFLFLRYLRQHDRKIAPTESNVDQPGAGITDDK